MRLSCWNTIGKEGWTHSCRVPTRTFWSRSGGLSSPVSKKVSFSNLFSYYLAMKEIPWLVWSYFHWINETSRAKSSANTGNPITTTQTEWHFVNRSFHTRYPTQVSLREWARRTRVGRQQARSSICSSRYWHSVNAATSTWCARERTCTAGCRMAWQSWRSATDYALSTRLGIPFLSVLLFIRCF